MTHEREHNHTVASPAAATVDNDVTPGRGSRSAELDAPTHPIVSGLIMRKAERDDNGVADGADAAIATATASSGMSLPGPIQRKFESSLGTDLSTVRLHIGGASATAAHAVGAKAYTMGQDIHFGAGHYDPSSTAGEHLLAHEVAHTVQQQGGTSTQMNKLEVSTPGDAFEHEADRAADAMVAGSTAVATSAGGLSRSIVQREPTPMPTAAPAPVAGAGPEPAASPLPDFGSIGSDAQHPLPQIPQAQVLTNYAQWKVKFFLGQLRQMEHSAWAPGRGAIQDSPQYQQTKTKVDGYQSDSLRFPDINAAWVSFVPAGNMASAQLADHLKLATDLGIGDLKKALAGLSTKDKDKIGDDMADMEAAQGKITAANKNFATQLNVFGPAQTRFLASSKELAGFMSGEVTRGLQKKLDEAKEKKEEIQQNIERAAAIGDGIQHAMGDITTVLGATMAEEKDAEKTAEALGEVKDKKLEQFKAMTLGEHTLLGKIIENIAAKAYQGKLDALQTQVNNARNLLEQTKLVSLQQTFEGLQERAQGDLAAMLAALQNVGSAARDLRDAMNPSEKPKHHGDKPGSQTGQPSDPIKNIERLAASAMATAALLDPAITSATVAKNHILAVLVPAKVTRSSQWYSAPQRGSFTDEDTGQSEKDKQGQRALAERQGELHQDDGVTGPDMTMANAMMQFVNGWIDQATKQKSTVQTQLTQVESLKAK